MRLSQLLLRGRNNIDLFRLVAACMVIYAHSYVLAPADDARDQINALVGFDDAGSLAVKIFFFLSGLVVTNSLLLKQRSVPFVVARVFRLWPALLLVLAVTCLVIGPIFTHLPLDTYFASANTYRYLIDNLVMHTRFELPGVFDDDLATRSVNGSLWTLPYEIAAYLLLVALFLVGAFKSRLLVLLIGGVFIVDPLVDNRLLLTWLPHQHWINHLPACFVFGAILAVFSDTLRVDVGIAIGLWLIFFVMKPSAYAPYSFYAALFYTLLYLSGVSWVLRLKPQADVSYGVYLWGYPLQQMLTRLLPDTGPQVNQVMAVFGAFLMGYLSWHLVEKHCIRLGARVARYIDDRLGAS